MKINFKTLTTFLRRSFVIITALHLIGFAGFYLYMSSSNKKEEAGTSQAASAPLIFYTATTATTPQVPFFAAKAEGFAKERGLDVRYWKNLEDLRTVVLAGEGDIWMGHLEGFARAASHGAPVTLVAVTGWKKFYFVSSNPIDRTGPQSKNINVLFQHLATTGKPLAVAPADSPALAILQKFLAKEGCPTIKVEGYAPQQLALEILNGNVQYALLPEPLLSELLAKRPKLMVIGSLEEEYAKNFGGKPELPWAGIAVKTSLLKENPDLIADFVEKMEKGTAELHGSPEAALKLLPEEVTKNMDREIILKSFSRDLLQVKPVWEVQDDVLSFLQVATPEIFSDAKKLPESFFPPESVVKAAEALKAKRLSEKNKEN